jgi:hypothetical protein
LHSSFIPEMIVITSSGVHCIIFEGHEIDIPVSVSAQIRWP